jgi:transposase
MNEITTVGVDLAKERISVHALDREGRVVVAKSMSRAGFEKWIEALATPCVVAMEACGMAHYWARRLAGLDHQPRIICAEFVAPFRKGGAGVKNDTRDAEAVAIAARQPDMRFVAVKSEAQQAALMVHRLRQGLIEERTALINRLRGLLAEFGVVISRRADRFKKALAEWIAGTELSEPLRELLTIGNSQLLRVEAALGELDRRVVQYVKGDAGAQRLKAIVGVGDITAGAAVASIGQPRAFKNGRQFAAFLGLTPRQHSTGGKTRLGHITKRGDTYLRTLLVQGARSTLMGALAADPQRATRLQHWMLRLYARAGYFRTLVAIANKHARMIWVILAKGEDYDAAAWKRHAQA